MSSRFQWFRARTLSTILAALVLAGAAAGPIALYLTLTRDTPAPATTLDQPDGRGGVAGEFAALFVAGWLRGDDLGFFNPTLTAEDSGLLVERVAPVRTTERGQGMFDVVVAADVVEYLAGSEEQFRPAGLRFYAVGVASDAVGDMTVLGLPALVEAPRVPDAHQMAVTDLRLPSTPELAEPARTLDGFFAAYLTGVADVGLFSSPNAGIAAVDPAPFASARVAELGWGPVPGVDQPNLRLARVVVDAVATSGRQRLEYSIVLAERDARWEVAQVLHAPVVLRADQP
ncbi:MAG: conjugal transfer protein [Actinomycetota bacterium]